AGLDQLGHLAEEQRQRERPDVRAVDIGVGVAGRETAHAGEEVFVAPHREVVHTAVARGHLAYGAHGQADELLVDLLVLSALMLLCGRKLCLYRVRPRVVGPYSAQPSEIFAGAHLYGPTRVRRDVRSATDHDP